MSESRYHPDDMCDAGFAQLSRGGDAHDDDPGPEVQELERDVWLGRRCVECLAAFPKAQPESVPNRHKTLCRVCTRLFVEQRGYNMGPERDANSAAWAAKNRKRKQQRNG